METSPFGFCEIYFHENIVRIAAIFEEEMHKKLHFNQSEDEEIQMIKRFVYLLSIHFNKGANGIFSFHFY